MHGNSELKQTYLTTFSSMSENNDKMNTTTNTAASNNKERPKSVRDYDHRNDKAWLYSFGAAMVPFTAFCYGHSRGATGRVVEAVVRSPVGVYGLLALPFVTLAMEKSIYDTVQAWQGIDPNVRPKERGGFPSGGAELPSFSLIPVQRPNEANCKPEFLRRTTNQDSP